MFCFSFLFNCFELEINLKSLFVQGTEILPSARMEIIGSRVLWTLSLLRSKHTIGQGISFSETSRLDALQGKRDPRK